MNSKIKSFFQVLSSNFFVSFAGILTGILIPILMSEEDFGYWQYYLTYGSYAAILLLGFCDGIYIQIGGKKYKDLEKEKLSTMFYFLFFILLAVTFILISVLQLVKFDDELKRYTLIMVAVSIFSQCVTSFFTLLNQATERFKTYAIGNILERTILLITILSFLLIGRIEIKLLLFISICSKIVVLAYYSFFSRDILKTAPKIYNGFAQNVKNNISIGLPITLCGLISLSMSGYTKMFIEWCSGMVDLAYYSFAFSTMSIISQVIVAASLIVFPSLKKADSKHIDSFLELGEKVTDLIIPLVMLAYFPIRIAVQIFVAKYMPSMCFVPFTLPIIIYQSKINILYTNIYKIKGMEKKLLSRGCIALLGNIAMVSILYWATKSLLVAAVATSLSYVLWYYILRKGTGSRLKFYDLFHIIIISAFAVAMSFLPVHYALAISLLLTLIFVISHKSEYIKILKQIKGMIKR